MLAADLTAAALVGLLGGVHCFGMCGGIVSALTFALPPEQRSPASRLPFLVAYNVGRILTYALLGVLAGLAGYALLDNLQPGGVNLLRLLAAILLISMGFYVAGWWSPLPYLEKAGARLWRHVRPAGQALLPLRSKSGALLLGGIWGLLPCGLVYSQLSFALAAGEPIGGGLVMLAFGLGTLPALILMGIAADQLRAWVRQRQVRMLAGLLLVLYGLWTGYGAMPHGTMGPHSGHQVADARTQDLSV